MFGAYLLMSWTVILVNDNNKISYINEHAPHDRRIALKNIEAKHGTFGRKVGGKYVIAIVPGNHPVYSGEERSIDWDWYRYL